MSPDVICGCCSLGFTGTYITEKRERKGGVEEVEGREEERKREANLGGVGKGSRS